MIDIRKIIQKYSHRHFKQDYISNTPVPWITLPDFLPSDLYHTITTEIDTIPKHHWRKFTRNGSYMEECSSFIDYAPTVRNLTLEMNSGEFVTWLELLTQENKLISDPHLIGAGLMRCYNGHSLKLHTDFNWNEELQLNRKLNVILYCSKEWDTKWGGDLEFCDFDDRSKIKKISPLPNTLLIWKYHPLLWHGHPNPITCPDGQSRDGLRMFYYNSNSMPEQKPHRSLYWQDDQGNPIDKK